MASAGLETVGIAELERDMADLIRRFPAEKKKFMRKQGQEMKKVGKSYAKRVLHKRTGNLLRGMTLTRPWDKGDETGIAMKFKAPAYHGHLIELGHKQVGHKPNYVQSGEIKGYSVLVRAKYLFSQQFMKNVDDALIGFIVEKLEGKK